MKILPLTRRDFVKSSSVAASALAFPQVVRSQEGGSANASLNVACVGVGGRGAAAVAALKD